MSENPVKAKAQELKEGLARDTGVSVEDVNKILNRLGLENALENRLHVANNADRVGLGDKVSLRLSNLSLNNIRIAAGEKAE